MDSLLLFLGDILSNLISGNSSKSVFMGWMERTVVAVVIMLITLVLFQMFDN